jgi:membrane associated rhomboid family serine protease
MTTLVNTLLGFSGTPITYTYTLTTIVTFAIQQTSNNPIFERYALTLSKIFPQHNAKYKSDLLGQATISENPKINLYEALIRYIGYRFTHCNKQHFLSNIIGLKILMGALEEKRGSKTCFIVTEIVAFGSAIFDLVDQRYSNPLRQSYGLSGIVYGLNGVLLGLDIERQMQTDELSAYEKRILKRDIICQAINIGLRLIIRQRTDITGYAAHFGGFLTGLCFGIVIAPIRITRNRIAFINIATRKLFFKKLLITCVFVILESGVIILFQDTSQRKSLIDKIFGTVYKSLFSFAKMIFH